LELLEIEPLAPRSDRVRGRSRRSTRARRRLGWIGVSFVALLAGSALLPLDPVAAGVEAETPELEALVRRFAAMPGFSARFEEEKRLSLLRAPLKSEGTLHYAPPDRIAYRVLRPAVSSWVVRGGQLFIGGPDRVRTVDLTSQPTLRPFIDALRFVLSGDLPALRDRFEVDFSAGTAPTGAWRLRLVPRSGPLRDVVSEIEVTGVEGILSTLRVRDSGGDETLDRFSDVDPARHFSETELARIFDVAAP
jgi:hypothetical protein